MVPSSIAKVEVSWDDVITGNLPESAYRAAFRQAVADVAAKAKEVLSESHSRTDQAVKLVLAGHVKLLADGTARVTSQTNGQAVYRVAPGMCECKDFPKAPLAFCKHRLAAGIAKRATALAQQRLGAQGAKTALVPVVTAVPMAAEQSPTYGRPEDVAPAPWPDAEPGLNAAPAPALPEAPASVNCYVDIAGRKVQVTLRDTDETRLLQRLTVLLAQYPASDTVAEPEAPYGQKARPEADAGSTPMCPRHGVRMHRSKFGVGRFYCSVKVADDDYCDQQATATQ
jgi:hypothetical protein